MAFQVVQAGNRQGRSAVSTSPEISFYGKTAQFRLNPALMEALGNPEKVEVHFDNETNRIAIVPSDAAYAVQLRKDSEKSSSRYFGFRQLAVMAGLTDESRFAVPVTKDEETGYLVASLSQETVAAAPAPRRGRKPKANGATEEAATEEADTTGEATTTTA